MCRFWLYTVIKLVTYSSEILDVMEDFIILLWQELILISYLWCCLFLLKCKLKRVKAFNIFYKYIYYPEK